jgi:hypothetical protein|nr:MAG TPA: hypothetical protein [Caudoviricetes sp.]
MMKNSEQSTNSQRKLIIRKILIKIVAIAILIGCAVYEPYYRAMMVGLLLIIILDM